jgi:hypothetical protein
LLGELLEAPGNRVRVRRLAVLPAEQPAVIVIVRPEVAAFAGSGPLSGFHLVKVA